MNLFTNQKQSHGCRKQMYGYQGIDGGRGDWDTGVDISARLHTKCISRSAVSDCVWQPHGLQPTRLFCPCNSPGKNTGVGNHSLLLGIFLTIADGDCSYEIKRCLLLGGKTMTNLDSILKSRNITLPTKVCLVKTMVFPVVMYRCERWGL